MSCESPLHTHAVHAGLYPDPTTGAVITPIYQTTTYAQEAVGQDKGFTYTRSGNPTVAALQRQLGALEDATALSFCTGMAAISALCLALLKAGDHVLCSDVVYGGTVRVLRQVFERFGVQATFVDTSNVGAIRDALRPETKLLLIESPANPTLKLTDIAAAASAAHDAGAWLAVDNTFLTAAGQLSFSFGADIVLYSTTKYIEGHNTTVGGAVLARDEEIVEKLRFVQNAVGISQSPFDAWLTLRGLKTLPSRMDRHAKNAEKVAIYLESHPKVARVYYPGLPSFPQYDLAKRQQRDGGGMLAFELVGGVQEGIRVMNAVKLCTLAENLGAVETLITHPASMTHGPIPAEERRAAGISDGLVRLSVGLERADDIIQDLNDALSDSTTLSEKNSS